MVARARRAVADTGDKCVLSTRIGTAAGAGRVSGTHPSHVESGIRVGIRVRPAQRRWTSAAAQWQDRVGWGRGRRGSSRQTGGSGGRGGGRGRRHGPALRGCRSARTAPASLPAPSCRHRRPRFWLPLTSAHAPRHLSPPCPPGPRCPRLPSTLCPARGQLRPAAPLPTPPSPSRLPPRVLQWCRRRRRQETIARPR